MTFWVYENWRAYGHRAAVHRGACGYCNEGQGLHLGTRSDNGAWHGPFQTAGAALDEAARTDGEVRPCGSCAPA